MTKELKQYWKKDKRRVVAFFIALILFGSAWMYFFYKIIWCRPYG